MRITLCLLACLGCLLIAPALARTSAASAQAAHLALNIQTEPQLLEPGPITLTLIPTLDGQPLRNTAAHITLTNKKKILFETTTLTDDQGVATLSMYLDEPGKPILTMTAAGERVSAQLIVKGRGVLVAGFLASLAVLIVLLLDRP